MSCNCGKRAQPTGYGQTSQPSGQPAAITPEEARSRANATANANRVSSLPTPSGATQSFTLQTRDGVTQSFGSKLEADAARVRAGGGTVRSA